MGGGLPYGSGLPIPPPPAHDNPVSLFGRLLAEAHRPSGASLLAPAGSPLPLPPPPQYASGLGSLLSGLPRQLSPLREFLAQLPKKRQIFISYHHGADRPYKNALSLFCDGYELLEDHSVDREIDSDDAGYVRETIRDDFIRGASATIVLCGAFTDQRKYVDWEIIDTLKKQAGLVAIQLPTFRVSLVIGSRFPDRLWDNIMSGYAVWYRWEELNANPGAVRGWIEESLRKEKWRIQNGRPRKFQNG
jgi:MTH538 TIR-like domain (DUF1863)